MTFDEMLYDTLSAIETTYPLFAKEDAQSPLIIYAPVAEIEELGMTTTMQGTPNAKYSIHVWAKTFAELEPILIQIRAGLKAYTGFHEVIGTSSKDFQDGEYRAIVDVSLWYSDK